MAKRPTIEDVARVSGVSVATVDRVLNGRAKVRKETAQKVYEAALEIGYHAASLIEQRIYAELPEYRLGFVLQKEKQYFYQYLTEELHRATKRINTARIKLDIVYAKSQSADEYAELIVKLGRRNHAVGTTAIDHIKVTSAVRKLRDEHIGTYALFNDFAQGVRESYIGLNNVKLGRGTAWMISKMAKSGEVAIFVGGHRWHGHELRETGFRSYFREYAPEFKILDTLVNLETRQLTYEATLELLDQHPKLVGLYCSGGGMEGAIEAMREKREPGEVVFIVNEDTPDSRAALGAGYLTMCNVTPLDKVCDETMHLMIHGIENGLSETPGQLFIQQGFLFPQML